MCVCVCVRERERERERERVPALETYLILQEESSNTSANLQDKNTQHQKAVLHSTKAKCAHIHTVTHIKTHESQPTALLCHRIVHISPTNAGPGGGGVPPAGVTGAASPCGRGWANRWQSIPTDSLLVGSVLCTSLTISGFTDYFD